MVSEVCATANVEFPVDGGEVSLDRPHADEQFRGDLTVVVAGAGEDGDASFGGREFSGGPLPTESYHLGLGDRDPRLRAECPELMLRGLEVAPRQRGRPAAAVDLAECQLCSGQLQ